uniref:Uncharacterized protein n=1 Tax=Melopsittacus undulatus TaxID=13146 RepID=A0A8V5GBS0_MELUD
SCCAGLMKGWLRTSCPLPSAVNWACFVSPGKGKGPNGHLMLQADPQQTAHGMCEPGEGAPLNSLNVPAASIYVFTHTYIYVYTHTLGFTYIIGNGKQHGHVLPYTITWQRS